VPPCSWFYCSNVYETTGWITWRFYMTLLNIMHTFPNEQIVVTAGQAAIFILKVAVLSLKNCNTWVAGPCMYFVTFTPLGMLKPLLIHYGGCYLLLVAILQTACVTKDWCMWSSWYHFLYVEIQTGTNSEVFIWFSMMSKENGSRDTQLWSQTFRAMTFE